MTAGGRLQCARCLRPQSTCLCAWVTPTSNQVDVLILQHPLEAHHAKGSARLLDLSLERSQMLVGETFDAAMLSRQLDDQGLVNVLLYPADADTPACNQLALPSTPDRLRLIVIDGTWRKSRKMLHLNPSLQSLPRLALHAPWPSAYRIRKAHRPDQLSTLEATCLALQQLESTSARYTGLLAAFDAFVGSMAR